jgi:hypothetical protein
MATDIVVRYAESDPEVAATIAVSMFSPAVTATAPRNLLVITGDWEGTLEREALRAVALATAPARDAPAARGRSDRDDRVRPRGTGLAHRPLRGFLHAGTGPRRAHAGDAGRHAQLFPQR